MVSHTRLMDDDEIWRDLERSDLADFFRPLLKDAPTVDLTFPEDLDFSLEQRAFVAILVARVVEDVAYELSHKWATHMINILVAGDLPTSEDLEHAATD